MHREVRERIITAEVRKLERRQAQERAAATPTPAPPTGEAAAVAHTLAAVEHALNAGDVRLLCDTSGGPVDPAVIAQQNAQPGGCESELEALTANALPMHLTLALRPDLATAVVTTADGERVSVDLVRDQTTWLLSFSDGDDPMPALATRSQ